MAETIGSLIDKLSIIELKIYHMREQFGRKDVSKNHLKDCKEKIKILKIQLSDLEKELADLTDLVLCRKQKLRVYYQFKMYNDPKYRIK